MQVQASEYPTRCFSLLLADRSHDFQVQAPPQPLTPQSRLPRATLPPITLAPARLGL